MKLVTIFAYAITVIKVSEYPFKQNKNMLKNMAVLLYKYFYNISYFYMLLRSIFFNIYKFPFLRSPNIGKIRVKLGQKLSAFPTFWAPAPIAVFNNCFHWYVANEETNKTVPAISFFPNILLNNLLLTVYMQNTLSKLVELLQQKMNNSLLGKMQAPFCATVH